MECVIPVATIECVVATLGFHIVGAGAAVEDVIPGSGSEIDATRAGVDGFIPARVKDVVVRDRIAE